MLLTRAPVAGGLGRILGPAAPRLACVKPAASVHPEPGSNSPLFISFFIFCFVSVPAVVYGIFYDGIFSLHHMQGLFFYLLFSLLRCFNCRRLLRAFSRLCRRFRTSRLPTVGFLWQYVNVLSWLPLLPGFHPRLSATAVAKLLLPRALSKSCRLNHP